VAKKKKDAFLRNDTGLRSHYHSNRIVTAQRLNDVISMILDGKDNNEIANFIVAKYGNTAKSARDIIADANQELTSRKQWELDDLLNAHVERYEYIYSKLIEIDAQLMAMNALKAKEKLIGLHRSDGTHFRVVGGAINSVSLVGTRTYFDPKRLDETQQARLEELLRKVD
jgi:hypothetical protein